MRFNFKTILMCLVPFVLLVGASAAFCADSSGSIAGIQIPSWLQAVLGIGGAVGSAAVPFLGKKVAKLLTLVQNLKNAITEIIGLFALLKTKIKDPELVKEYNEACEAVAKTLKDTGNASLIQKAAMFERFKLPVAQGGIVPVPEV